MKIQQRPWTGGIFAIILLTAAGLTAFADFDTFARRYKTAGARERETLTQAFVTHQQANNGFPIVQTDGTVIFVYIGTGGEKNVGLVGDFRTRHFYSVYWDKPGIPMTPIAADGHIFFTRLKVRPGARLDYKFVIDGKFRTDPLNPRRWDGGIEGEVSELTMPGYREPTEIHPRKDTPKGSVHTLDETWAKPKVRIYLPANYHPSHTYPVIYTADGGAWMKYIKLPVILDNLIADRIIRPVIAVMIDSAEDRRSWYFYNPAYIRYLEKVVEFVESRYPVRRDVGGRLLTGASAGGRAALFVSLERPALFRNLGMLSPSLTGSPHYYEPYFSGRKRPDPTLNIWMSAGTYENYIHEDVKVMERYFKQVGLKNKTVYTPEGHSFGTWRHLIKDMLIYFFPRIKNESKK